MNEFVGVQYRLGQSVLDWLSKDVIAVVVIENKNVIVSMTRGDGKPASLVSIYLPFRGTDVDDRSITCVCARIAWKIRDWVGISVGSTLGSGCTWVIASGLAGYRALFLFGRAQIFLLLLQMALDGCFGLGGKAA